MYIKYFFCQTFFVTVSVTKKKIGHVNEAYQVMYPVLDNIILVILVDLFSAKVLTKFQTKSSDHSSILAEVRIFFLWHIL